MEINIQQARAIFTQAVIDVYRQNPRPTSFLRSFFPDTFSDTKLLSLEVQRGLELIAADVYRHEEGQRNKVSLSDQKIFEPTFFHEYIVLNDMQVYDMAIGEDASTVAFAQLVRDTADWVGRMQDKIDRAAEKQCADVFQSGIITVGAGDNIDFKRKAESLVDLGSAGGYWTSSSVDPAVSISNGAIFIRTEGKTTASMYDVILGSDAFFGLTNNPIFQKKYDIKDFHLGELNTPQAQATGGTLHGMISAGSYKARLWTYPQYYDVPSGTPGEYNHVPYVAADTMIVLPENPRFQFGYAAVPRLPGQGQTKGASVVFDVLDEKLSAHEMHIKSAGIPIPTAVNQIFSAKVTNN